MQRMLAVVAANPAADGAGLIAMVCFIAWPLFQARSMMLIACIGNNLCFALQYALLGHWTARSICCRGIGVDHSAGRGLQPLPQLIILFVGIVAVTTALATLTYYTVEQPMIGEAHLGRVLKCYADYYNNFRTHHPLTRMRRFLVRLSESEASNHTPSLADFTITTVRQDKPDASSGRNSRLGKGNEPPHRESSLGLMEATT